LLLRFKVTTNNQYIQLFITLFLVVQQARLFATLG